MVEYCFHSQDQRNYVKRRARKKSLPLILIGRNGIPVFTGKHYALQGYTSNECTHGFVYTTVGVHTVADMGVKYDVCYGMHTASGLGLWTCWPNLCIRGLQVDRQRQDVKDLNSD